MDGLDLPQEELRELAGQVIDAAGNPDEPFGMYFFTPGEAQSALARSVEHEVFEQWFGNSEELLAAEYDRYEGDTLFFSVLDHRRRLPAGMCRVGLPSHRQCKSFDDLEKIWGVSINELLPASTAGWDVAETWDSMTIAVADDYRGKATDGLISLAILQTGTQAMRRSGHRFTVAIFDTNVLALLQAMMANPYQQFPGIGPRRYLDSPASLPVYLDLDDWEPRLLTADPGMHELVFHGNGVEGAVRGPAWATLLRACALDPQPTSTEIAHSSSL